MDQTLDLKGKSINNDFDAPIDVPMNKRTTVPIPAHRAVGTLPPQSPPQPRMRLRWTSPTTAEATIGNRPIA